MKPIFIIVLLTIVQWSFAQSLPVITSPPANQTVTPGTTATFAVTATGATSYQWVYNGTNISGATGATLQVSGAQTNNNGYYLVIAKNATGWVPSQMAYLSVVGTAGTVPFSNVGGNQAISTATFTAINSGTVQVFAGPQLDQMQPNGPFINYKSTAQQVPI